MKTKEELNALKEEAEVVSSKLAELTEDELAQASGGETVSDGNCQQTVTLNCNRKCKSLYSSICNGCKYKSRPGLL